MGDAPALPTEPCWLVRRPRAPMPTPPAPRPPPETTLESPYRAPEASAVEPSSTTDESSDPARGRLPVTSGLEARGSARALPSCPVDTPANSLGSSDAKASAQDDATDPRRYPSPALSPPAAWPSRGDAAAAAAPATAAPALPTDSTPLALPSGRIVPDPSTVRRPPTDRPHRRFFCPARRELCPTFAAEPRSRLRRCCPPGVAAPPTSSSPSSSSLESPKSPAEPVAAASLGVDPRQQQTQQLPQQRRQQDAPGSDHRTPGPGGPHRR